LDEKSSFPLPLVAKSDKDQKVRLVEEKTTDLDKQMQKWSKKSIEFVVIQKVGDSKLIALIDNGETKSLLTERAYMKIKDKGNPLKVSQTHFKGCIGTTFARVRKIRL